MIVLTAEIDIKGENDSPFVLGESQLGYSTFGTNIDTTFVVDKRNILSLESEIRDRADADKPSFGVISSGGSMSFKDKNGMFESYANIGSLRGGEPIKVFLINSINHNKQQVGSYYAADWDYDNDNRSVSVSFNDDLERMQGIATPTLNLLEQDGVSLLDLYSKAKEIAINNGFQFDETNTSALDFMQKMKVSYAYMLSGNLWQLFDKISVACCANVFVNRLGMVEIRR